MPKVVLDIDDEFYNLFRKQHKVVKDIFPSFPDYLVYRLSNPLIFKINMGTEKVFDNQDDVILDVMSYTDLVNETNQIKNQIKDLICYLIEKDRVTHADLMMFKEQVIDKITLLESITRKDLRNFREELFKFKKAILEAYGKPQQKKTSAEDRL